MSAFTKDFTFDSLSRIGDDSCGISQRNVQNTSQSKLFINQLFLSRLWNESVQLSLPLSQPNVNFPPEGSKLAQVDVMLIQIPIY